MAKWTKEEKTQYKEKVRSVMARKPRISQYELAKVLNISPATAWKLKKEVVAENTKFISDQKVEEEVGKMEMEYEQMALECWRIIREEGAKNKDKIDAVKTVVAARKNLFDTKFDSGLFKRKLGELETGTLTKEESDLIKRAIELDYGNQTKPQGESNPAGGNSTTGNPGEGSQE